jgi:lipid-binding SYLF domain-containing protein
MKKVTFAFWAILLTGTICLAVFNQAAAQPIGKYPDAEGTVTNLTPSTATEKQNGILATITVKGVAIQVTSETKLRIEKGKVVEPASAAELKIGDRVSAWFKTPAESPRKAGTLIIFRPGTGGVPMPPKAP